LFKKRKTIRKALSVQGWTDKKKLELLFDLCAKTRNIEGDILEIGSAWGRSAILLGLSSTKKIYSIDPHSGGLSFLKKGMDQNSYDEFIENLKKFSLLTKTIVYKKTTYEVLSERSLQDKCFSLIHIDGLHTAEAVEIDFNFSFPKLNKGGVMIFDDYFENSVIEMRNKINELAFRKKVQLRSDPEVGYTYFFK